MSIGSRLLCDRHYFSFHPALATTEEIELNGAIALDRLNFLLTLAAKDPQNHFKEGYIWVWNTYEQWAEDMPWWSARTIRRILDRLEEVGVIVTAVFNRMPMDNTKWYRIDYEALRRITGETRSLEHPELQPGQSGHIVATGISDTGSPQIQRRRPGQSGHLRMVKMAIASGQDGHSNNQNSPTEQSAEQEGSANALPLLVNPTPLSKEVEEVPKLSDPQPPSSAAPPSPEKRKKRSQSSRADFEVKLKWFDEVFRVHYPYRLTESGGRVREMGKVRENPKKYLDRIPLEVIENGGATEALRAMIRVRLDDYRKKNNQDPPKVTPRDTGHWVWALPYIPDPVKWFNDGRWMSEYVDAETATREEGTAGLSKTAHYNLAKDKGVVIGMEGGEKVYLSDYRTLTWDEFAAEFPVEKLREELTCART